MFVRFSLAVLLILLSLMGADSFAGGSGRSSESESPCYETSSLTGFNTTRKGMLFPFLTVTSEKKETGTRCFFARVSARGAGYSMDGIEIYNTIGDPPAFYDFGQITAGVVVMPRPQAAAQGERVICHLKGEGLDSMVGGRLTLTLLRNGIKKDYREFEMQAQFNHRNGELQLVDAGSHTSFDRMHFLVKRVAFAPVGIDKFLLFQGAQTGRTIKAVEEGRPSLEIELSDLPRVDFN